jgi:uncharacterized protein (DUF1800 family)
MPSIAPFTGNLTRQQAVHLLHRASIGYAQADIDALEGMSVSAAVDFLYNQTAPDPPLPIDPNTNQSYAFREEFTNGSIPGRNRFYTQIWYLKEMFVSTAPAKEKMTLFMHTHFTNDMVKTVYGFPLYHQNELFRKYALGNFKILATKVCRDYAMSVFLDGWTNQVQNPNENFPREFLELYSIGKGSQIGPGNYTTFTEDDVREAARVLTGFLPVGFVPDGTIAGAPPIEIDSDTGLYTCSIWDIRHDAGTKNFSAAFQNTSISTGPNTVTNIEAELDAFIDMVFAQEATARNICRKLYRFFCYYEITPAIENDIITPLAATFQANNYELLPVLKQLFNSQHFFDQDDAIIENNNIGAIVKSPVELIVGAFKYFNVDLGLSLDTATYYGALGRLTTYIETMGMTLFQPPEVAGYPAYHQAPAYNRNWISATFLVSRFDAFERLTVGIPINGGALFLKIDSVDFCQNSGNFSDPSDPNILIDNLVNDLFPFGVESNKRVALKNILTDGDPDYYWTDAWIVYTGGGTDATVRIRLNNLFNAILQSAEFQLF